jgi:poly-gamma-glutamate synthesis protein (capsule biosynthesis protein)
MKTIVLCAAIALVGCDAPEARRLGEAVLATAAAAEPTVAEGPTRPAVARPEPTVITVSAVGDLAIGDLHYGAGAPGSFAAQLREVPEPLDYPFEKVAAVFRTDDLTIGNLEGTFTERAAWSNPVFSIRGKPAYAAMLPRGGVDVVNLDNNHAMDYGLEGHEDTKKALAAAGVAFFGGDLVDRRTLRGVEVVNLGYLGGPAKTRERMVAAVRREKKPNNLVIVSFHWGVEAFYATHPDQIALGRAAVDAGADLVLGHHPHVLQGIETYKDRHIVYSLGNFVFGANSMPRDMDSIIYQEKFVLEGGSLARVEQVILPVRISGANDRNDFRPVLLEGAERARVLGKVEKMSAAL